MKVVVTGGNGFIGRYTVERLLADGYEPLVFDRGAGGDFLGDIRDATAVNEAMAHVDAWIHLAGVLGTQETITNPMPAVETNVIGGINVLEAAAQYNLPGVCIAVGNYWMENTYSITKTTIERFCAMYRQERGLPVSVVRAFNAYGPRQSIARPFGPSKVRKIMPAFICRALTGQPIEVYGDGNQIMDMIYVEDVARVLVGSLTEVIDVGPREDVIQAGSGNRTTVLEIAHAVLDEVERQTGIQGSVTHLPMRPGEPEGDVVLADNPALDSLMPFQLGVIKTVRWFVKEWLPTWQG